MGVLDIATALRRINAAIRQGGDLRSAVREDLTLLHREFKEARSGHADYSMKLQIDSLVSDIDRAAGDDRRLRILLDFLIGDENRMNALLTLAERDDFVEFYQALEDDWVAWKARRRERDGHKF